MTHSALSVATTIEPCSPLDDSTVLGRPEESLLVSIVEVAHSISRRHQFFLWARGALQSLVPHEILLCGYGDWRRRSFGVDKFAGRPFPEQMYTELSDPDQGVMLQAHTLWDGLGHGPLLVYSRESAADEHSLLKAVLRRHQISNCVFHGLPQVNGSPSAFFCFANVTEPVTRRTTYFLELVVPCLYAALVRVMHGERRRDDGKVTREASRPRTATLPRSITLREVQILQWVQEGKSNREIAEVLKISPLTVKNHVQNILKKLKVRNRAQAVSCAIGARLIQSGAPSVSKEKVVRTAQPVMEKR